MNITDRYDLVVMFGLDTSLKDTVRIETIAEWEGDIYSYSVIEEYVR